MRDQVGTSRVACSAAIGFAGINGSGQGSAGAVNAVIMDHYTS